MKSKIWVIAVREYLAVVRSKAFVISLVIMPLMMGGSILMQKMTENVKDTRDRGFAIIDHTPGEAIYPTLARDVDMRNKTIFDPKTNRQNEAKFVLEKLSPAAPGTPTDEQRFQLAERVRKGNLFGFAEIGPGIYATPTNTLDPTGLGDDLIVRYQTNTPTFSDFKQLLSRSINRAVRAKRLTDAGVSQEKFDALLAQVDVVNKGLAHKDERGAITYSRAESQIATLFVPFGLVMLMFMVVLIGAIPLTQGVIEEKQQRIAEVLLGSVRPFEMMSGKVLGLVGTSTTLIGVYLGGAYFMAHKFGFTEYLPISLILWFLVFQILAVLMFGSLYIAIGASCTEAKEMQSLLMPVNLVMALPIMVIVNIIQNPNGPLARMMTFFPPATPMITVARMSVPPGIPLWESLVAVAIVLVTTTVLIWASGRIFRVGILMQGKGANLAQIARWVFTG